MAFNFMTAFHRALQDPEAYYSFQKEMNSKAVEQVFFNFYGGKTVFEAVVLPKGLGTTYEPTDKVLRVRPLGIHDFIIPEPCVFEGHPEKIQKVLELHPMAYPDSTDPYKTSETSDAGFASGQIVFCRLAEGKSHSLIYERGKRRSGGLTRGFSCVNSVDGKTKQPLKKAFTEGGYGQPQRVDVPISKSQSQKIENFIEKIKKSPSFKGWSGQALAGVVANAQAESAFKQLANGDSIKFYEGANVSKKRMDNVRKRNINGKCSWGYWQLNICPDDGSGKQLADSKGIDTTTPEGKQAFIKLMKSDEEQFKWVSQKMSAILSQGKTGKDAYQAGYDITVNFERPQNRYEKGVERGNLAQSIYKKFQSILDA